LERSKRRILVVGTTRDYIDHIRARMPGRALFLTDPRAVAPGIAPVPRNEEIICPLSDLRAVRTSLNHFLRKYDISLSGLACFDCEWLWTAAVIAEDRNLPFPSTQAVLRCRNKFLSKRLWTNHGVSCPEVREVFCPEDILEFLRKTGGPVILKPRSGSGSELTYRCNTADEVREGYGKIREGLHKRAADPLFQSQGTEGHPTAICEEFISGDEYSCDIYFDGETAQILRLARKYFREEMPLGTALGYEIPVRFPQGVSPETSLLEFGKAARVLGLTRSLCMIDFIVRDGRVYLLEMSPRLGGDCLPALIEQSCGVDMLEVALGFAEGALPTMPEKARWNHVVGVRFHAERPGTLQGIRSDFQKWGKDIRSQVWRRHPGDRIGLPPDDYDSWLLGHVIFTPRPGMEIATQVRNLLRAVKTDIR
jgi:biotin carboxylase